MPHFYQVSHMEYAQILRSPIPQKAKMIDFCTSITYIYREKYSFFQERNFSWIRIK